jgi:hypothetical protein
MIFDRRRDGPLSRRDFLGAAFAAGVLPIVPGAACAASPKRLVATTRVLEVNGWPSKVFALIGPDGRPGIDLAPGERFRVDLANQAGTRGSAVSTRAKRV